MEIFNELLAKANTKEDTTIQCHVDDCHVFIMRSCVLMQCNILCKNRQLQATIKVAYRNACITTIQQTH